jgi:hypothetical protein
VLDPIKNIVTQLLDQGILLVPIILGLCLAVYGVVMMMGDHAKGRQGMVWSLIGAAVALGAKTIAANVHP